MKMKPLNYKERRKAIIQFFISLIPFLITMPLFVYIYCITAKAHSEFIERKYESQNKRHQEQEKSNDNINEVFTLNDLIDNNKKTIGEYEYNNKNKRMTKVIQSSLSEMKKEDSPNCYKIVFDGMRDAQGVVDSVHVNKKDLYKIRKNLKKCNESYEEEKLKLLK